MPPTRPSPPLTRDQELAEVVRLLGARVAAAHHLHLRRDALLDQLVREGACGGGSSKDGRAVNGPTCAWRAAAAAAARVGSAPIVRRCSSVPLNIASQAQRRRKGCAPRTRAAPPRPPYCTSPQRPPRLFPQRMAWHTQQPARPHAHRRPRATPQWRGTPAASAPPAPCCRPACAARRPGYAAARKGGGVLDELLLPYWRAWAGWEGNRRRRFDSNAWWGRQSARHGHAPGSSPLGRGGPLPAQAGSRPAQTSRECKAGR